MQRLHHPLKPWGRGALTGLVLAAALASTAAANQQPREVVRVLRVNDGQEVLVESQGQGRAVKLSCLEAPRPDQQPWASEATAALRELLPEGTEITLELRARDVEGRLVGRLLPRTDRLSQTNPNISRGDIGESLIRQGHAFVRDGHLGRCDDLLYKTLEAKAKAERLGVWSVPDGIPRPWDHKEAQRDRGMAE